MKSLKTNLKKAKFCPSEYDHALSNKNKILQNNKQRCGVYRWVNKINDKGYVESSVNFSSRWCFATQLFFFKLLN